MTVTITLEQHIEELRAELSNGCDPRELRKIARELKAAMAQMLQRNASIGVWLDRTG